MEDTPSFRGVPIRYEDKVTGEKVLVKDFTKCDVLEARYKADCEEIARLLRRVDQQKSENEVLHRKVNDLGHKFCQARRERDKLAQKLREAEVKAQKYGSLLEKLSYLIYKETTC